MTVVIILTLAILIVFYKPLAFLLKVIIKGALYSALVYVLNFITSVFGITAGVNLVTALLYGIFGIYGVVLSYFSGLLYTFKL